MGLCQFPLNGTQASLARETERPTPEVSAYLEVNGQRSGDPTRYWNVRVELASELPSKLRKHPTPRAVCESVMVNFLILSLSVEHRHQLSFFVVAQNYVSTKKKIISII